MSWDRKRDRMIEEQIRARGIRDRSVLATMRKVPRHRFVEEALRDRSYLDKALPVGEKQTISQPFIVALMSAALELRGGERVLELGTGSGYQTAILAELAETVFTVERLPGLARQARQRLERLGYYNVLVQIGDGTIGWSEHAPFDAIIVTATGPKVPRPLLEQLAVGGRLVMPIGTGDEQVLIRIWRDEGGFREEELGTCHFVPLIGRYGWEK